MGEPRPRLTLAAALLLAAGCTSDGVRDGRRDDPLLGAGVRATSQPVAVATADGANTAQGPPPPAYQPKPPLTAAVPTSNAALASGGFQPLQGSNDLRIGAGPPAPGVPVGGRQVPPPGGPTPAQPVSTNPAPVTAVPPPGAPVPVGGVPPSPTGTFTAPRGTTLEQLYGAVAARGANWHKMTYNNTTREYTFQLNVPSRLNTAVVRTVEATAAGPAEAIQRALEQLGDER